MSMRRFLGCFAFLFILGCGAEDATFDDAVESTARLVSPAPVAPEPTLKPVGGDDDPQCHWCPGTPAVLRCCVNGPEGLVCYPASC